MNLLSGQSGDSLVFRKALILFILLSLSVGGVSGRAISESQAQKQSEEITADEIRDAQQTAKLFIKRLSETRDLRPIIKEMYATGFTKGALKSELLMGLIGLPVGDTEQSSQEELLSYYTLAFSVQYVLTALLASKVSLDEEAAAKSFELLPQNVKDYMRSVEEPKGIKPQERVRFLNEANEKTLTLLKEYLSKNPPEGTEQFQKNLAAFTAHLNDEGNHWGKPSVMVFEEKGYGYPAGTRFIRMEVPFHIGLVLVKEKGQLKILFATSVIPTD
jgi:hypothetical protein